MTSTVSTPAAPAPGATATSMLATLRQRAAASLEFSVYIHVSGEPNDSDLVRISADGLPFCWGPMTFVRYGTHLWRWFEGGGNVRRGRPFSWRTLQFFAEVAAETDPASLGLTVFRAREGGLAPLRDLLVRAGAGLHGTIYERRPQPFARRIAYGLRSTAADETLFAALRDHAALRSAEFAYVDGARVIAKRYAESVGSYELPLESTWCFPGATSISIDCGSAFNAAAKWNPNLRGSFLVGDCLREAATHETAVLPMRDLARALARTRPL